MEQETGTKQDRDIIYPDTDLKFRVDFSLDDFDPQADPWVLTLRNEFRKLPITKDDCLVDAEGHFYITVRARLGRTFVTATCSIPDGDYADGYRQETDEQFLFEPYCTMPDYAKGYCRHPHWVTFTRVWMSNFNDDGLIMLLDRYGQVIHDRNGNPIYVHKYRNQ